MSINFYQLNCNNSDSRELVNIGFKTQGTSRAFCFLSSLSQSLMTGLLDPSTSMEQLNETVSYIQRRIEARKFYNLMSWIPFTEANFVSKLIKQVKIQIDQKESDLIKENSIQLLELSKVARKNKTDCEQYFIATAYLVDLIKVAEKVTKKSNQVQLYYGLGENEIGMIGSSPTSFMNSKRSSLIPFKVEFEPTHQLVKIIDPPDCTDDFPTRYLTMAGDSHYNITKQDIFGTLINLKK